jgi:cell division protein FtsN
MDAGGDAGVNAGESMDAVAAMSAMAAMIVPSGAVPRPKPADVPGAAVAPASSTQVTGAAARSASDPVNLLAAPAATDKPRVTASTAPAATIPSSAAPAQSGYVVQVSSQRSADQAKTSFADMQRRYNSILGGFYPNIQRADLGDKGTYYRVRIGPMKRESALHVCEQLKSAGGSCFVTR